MAFPSEKELKKIRPILERAEPSMYLPENASKVDCIKYELCKKFVIYLLATKTSPKQLAKKLKVDLSRVNKLVKYRIEYFTIDQLIDFSERIHLNFNIKVA